MSAARHIIALLKSHVEGDDKEFLSVAMQAAAHEARLGHGAIAQQLRDLVDEAKRRSAAVQTRPGQLIVLEPRGELAHLGVLRRRNHLPALHRAGVVHGDVIQQLPGLARIGGLGGHCRTKCAGQGEQQTESGYESHGGGHP